LSHIFPSNPQVGLGVFLEKPSGFWHLAQLILSLLNDFRNARVFPLYSLKSLSNIYFMKLISKRASPYFLTEQMIAIGSDASSVEFAPFDENKKAKKDKRTPEPSQLSQLPWM